MKAIVHFYKFNCPMAGGRFSIKLKFTIQWKFVPCELFHMERRKLRIFAWKKITLNQE